MTDQDTAVFLRSALADVGSSPAAMECQGYITVRAAQRVAAGGTDHRSGIPSPVQKQHDLLFLLQGGAHGFLKRIAQDHAVRGRYLLSEIYDLCPRKRSRACPFVQAHQADPSASCQIRRLNGRSRRAKHHTGSLQFSSAHRDLSRVIAGRLTAPVTLFMLFVYDDNPQIREGGKQGRSRPDHDIQVALGSTVKLILLLTRAHFRMNDRNSAVEPVIEPHQCLISQRDLRDQDNCLLPLRNHMRDQLYVDLCLSASGHSLNQETAVRFFVRPGDDAVRGAPLRFIELHL